MRKPPVQSRSLAALGSPHNMAEERVQRRLAAILAVDVVGYTRLMQQDEVGTFERLRTHRKELMEPRIAQHHGRIFKLTGDGLLAEFGGVATRPANSRKER